MMIISPQFINLIAGSKLIVGDDLESETACIETVTFPFQGQEVTIIDTPGFDDSRSSDPDNDLTDTKILNMISDFVVAKLVYLPS